MGTDEPDETYDDIEIEEVRHGVVRMHESHWPHDCHEFDLVAMTLRYGHQGSLDSENPDDWQQWSSVQLRMHDGVLEQWVSEEDWTESRRLLVDWARRTQESYAKFPALKSYATDPDEADTALDAHDKTQPGWTPVRAEMASAALAYAQRKGLLSG